MNERKKLPLLIKSFKSVARYLPKTNNGLALIIPLIILIPVFIFIQIKHPNNLPTNLIIIGSIYVILVLSNIISESYGKKRHKSILYGKKLSRLQEYGFIVENIGDYWGYKGEYKLYFFKIFYNWHTNIPGKKFGELCILMYINYPENINSDQDIEKLKSLKKKYSAGTFLASDYLVYFKNANIQLHTSFNTFTPFEDISTKIEFLINIAITEALNPLDERSVDSLIQKDPFQYGPFIETFWEAHGLAK